MIPGRVIAIVLSRFDLAHVPDDIRTLSPESTHFSERPFHGTASPGSATAVERSEASGSELGMPYAGGSEAGDMEVEELEVGDPEWSLLDGVISISFLGLFIILDG